MGWGWKREIMSDKITPSIKGSDPKNPKWPLGLGVIPAGGADGGRVDYLPALKGRAH